jgi:hypothetical protein
MAATAISCRQGFDKVYINPRVIPGADVQSVYLEEYNDLVSCLQPKDQDCDVSPHALAISRQTMPGLVACATFQLTTWASTESERELLRDYGDACLASQEPLIRWSGIYAVYEAGSSETAIATLRKDYAFLTTRPDMPSVAVNADGDYISAVSPAVSLASLREKLITLIGEAEIWEAKPVIRAITEDDGEWHEGTKLASQCALEALCGNGK